MVWEWQKRNILVLPAVALCDLSKAEESNAIAREEGHASPRA